jgi:low temperature requirement protein LtrA
VHEDPVLAAADAYSYIHLIIVAGIIIFAGGVRLVVHNPVSGSMPPSGRFALCGGVGVYLLGVTGFRWRIAGERSTASALSAVALFLVAAFGGAWPAWSIAAAMAVILGLLCAAESRGRGELTASAATRSRSDGH